MASRPEARISLAADAESAPTRAVLDRTEPRSTPRADPSARELLEDVQDLLRQIVNMLNDPICDEHARGASFRLARAHALTLLDHLAAISESL
jgi:hypothetical protein